MRLIATVMLAALIGLFLPTAGAYEPESGVWWNPAESGTGFTIELQDNMMAVAVYGGAQNGSAKWYSATGLIDGNAYFEADLLSYRSLQPMGGAYTGRPTIERNHGKLRIQFDPNDNRRATLTWPSGRSIPIQRHEYYFERPEDDARVTSDVLRMLGEWQYVVDYSDDPNAFPFGGDVLVYDYYDLDSNGWYYGGCRPDNAMVGGCSDYALTYHESVGEYDRHDGLHYNLVVDGYDADGYEWWALYIMNMGTNDGSGDLVLYPAGTDPDDGYVYTARTFRTASRTFVQEGVGPAKHGAQKGRRSGMAAQLGLKCPEPGQGTAKSGRFDLQALAPKVRELEARLREQTARR